MDLLDGYTSGEKIKKFVWEANLAQEVAEYILNVPVDQLVMFNTTKADSVMIVRQLNVNSYELLLRVGYNSDKLLLDFLKKEDIILYNFDSIFQQQIKIIEEKLPGDRRTFKTFPLPENCIEIFLLSGINNVSWKLETYWVGLYEV